MFTSKQGGFEGTTVIAAGVRVEGNFAGEGAMVIDGTVQGTITTKAGIVVGQTADIEANIRAGAVVIAGRVKGSIVARDRVELAAGSRVDGDVTTKTLVVAEGATLNGKCSMNSGEGAARSGNGREREADPSPRRSTAA